MVYTLANGINKQMKALSILLLVALAQCAPHLIVEKVCLSKIIKFVIVQGIDTPTNYIGCNHDFTIMYRVDNIGEEYFQCVYLMVRDVFNVTITDQWPAEGFDIDVEFPIVIDELAAYLLRE